VGRRKGREGGREGGRTLKCFVCSRNRHSRAARHFFPFLPSPAAVEGGEEKGREVMASLSLLKASLRSWGRRKERRVNEFRREEGGKVGGRREGGREGGRGKSYLPLGAPKRR
jgi:hypothetical protein